MGKRIILIDGNSLINRAYYAIQRPMITKEGIYTHAIYGFINILNKIYRDYEPDYLAIAFDRKAPTFRHIEFSDYKAGRRKMPPELAMQMPILKEVLEAMNVSMLETDGFEADDIIGTIVKRSEEEGLEPLVITGDKDELQLASDKTKILITKKGISDFELFSNDTMNEKYGFSALQFIDYKGLMGDQSDNIPGVPGVGEKTAQKLIQQFGSIENMIANSDKITPEKLRLKIEENTQIAMMSKRLATIHTGVPIEFNIKQFSIGKPDYKRLVELYTKLEFNSLINKLNINPDDKLNINKLDDNERMIANQNSEATKRILIDSPAKIDVLEEAITALFKSDESDKSLYIKVFGDNNHKGVPEVYCISILLTNTYFFIYGTDHEIIVKTALLLAKTGVGIAGHDLKTDYYALLCHIPDQEPVPQDALIFKTVFDSAIAQYLIEPERTNYGIKNMMLSYFGENIQDESEFYKENGQMGFLAASENSLADYGMKWCWAVKRLRSVISGIIANEKYEELFYDIELPLIEVLASMEHLGFKVNRQELINAGAILTESIADISKRIFQLAGEEFNINSTKQLGLILFDKLGLASGKKTKSGYSTGIDVLEKLREEHPIIPLILEYRNLSKLNSTYIEGLLPLIASDGKIHAHFNQTVAATGRISCTEPNLQNIPIRQESGRKLRKAFTADSGDYLLIGADYSQIELRLLADMSGDETLIQGFVSGDDVHRITASKVFGVPESEVTNLQRSNAKAVNFGVIYGMSGFGLSEELNISRKEAEKYISEYFKKYTKVKEFLDGLVLECKANGFVSTIMNRKRTIHEINAANYMVRQLGERLAMNSPLQGSAADIIKIAMVNVYKELRKEGLKSSLILQVHDELIIHTYKNEIESVKMILADKMCNAVKLKVPLEISIDIGNSWYDLK